MHAAVLAREFDQQYRLRLTDQRAFDDGAKCRIRARELDHGAIDELDRGWLQGDDVLRRRHRRTKRREIEHAQGLACRQSGELQLEARKIGERSLGADEEVGEIDRAIARIGALALRIEHIDVVAPDAAQHAGDHAADFVALAGTDRRERLGQRIRFGIMHFPGRTKCHFTAVGQNRLDADNVVHHVAVLDRARAAGIVARHASDRRLRRCAHVDRKPEPVRTEVGVELIEHHTRLNGHGHRVRVEVDNLTQRFAVINHQCLADGLPALRRPGAARKDRHLELARDSQCGPRVGFVTRHDHADGEDLVDGSVGRVAPARSDVKQDVTAAFGGEPLYERRAGCNTRRSAREPRIDPDGVLDRCVHGQGAERKARRPAE